MLSFDVEALFLFLLLSIGQLVGMHETVDVLTIRKIWIPDSSWQVGMILVMNHKYVPYILKLMAFSSFLYTCFSSEQNPEVM